MDGGWEDQPLLQLPGPTPRDEAGPDRILLGGQRDAGRWQDHIWAAPPGRLPVRKRPQGEGGQKGEKKIYKKIKLKELVVITSYSLLHAIFFVLNISFRLGTNFERADFALYLLMFATVRKESKIIFLYCLSFFLSAFPPQFLSRGRPDQTRNFLTH